MRVKPITRPVRRFLIIGMMAGLVALPAFLGNPFRISLAITIGIYSILALSLNLLFGYTGLLALGLNGFFAIGAYVMVISQVRFGLSSGVAIIIAILACAVIALMVGFPLLRLDGHYFAMATLAFGLIVQSLALRWFLVTGGSAGLRSPPLTILGFELSSHLYYVTLACAVGVFAFCHILVGSKVGRVLKAIRDDEVATQTIGVNTTYYKLVMFIVAAVFSSVAGLLYTYLNHQVIPTLAGIQLVLQMLIMVIVGGIASNVGAVIGAIFIVLLPQFLVGFEEYQLFVFGILVLLIFIFAPRGLVGLFQVAWEKAYRRLARSGLLLSPNREGASLSEPITEGDDPGLVE